MDDQVGRIVRTLDTQGLTDDTMVVFTSDNGGLIKRYDYNERSDDIVGDLAPLKGEKGSLHEGGIRVPLIVKHPKKVKAGTICSEPTISYDFYPTFVEAGEGSLPENQTIDGLSLLPLLNNPKAKLNRQGDPLALSSLSPRPARQRHPGEGLEIHRIPGWHRRRRVVSHRQGLK